MRWTSHMQECLNQIESQQDHPLDKILVQYVKIQLDQGSFSRCECGPG
jgi:hypothetical protein